jgi:hypothetical protein
VSAYLPNSWIVCAIASAILIGETIVGFGVTLLTVKGIARLLSWLMTIAATAGMERLTASEPAGVRMIAIILALLYGTKAVVSVECGVRLTAVRWVGFSWFWFGMRPALFARTGNKPLPGCRKSLINGSIDLTIGFAATITARGVWYGRDWLGDEAARWLATVLLLIGLSLVVHFGIFSLLAAFWRARGVDCRPLFKAPVLSTSLSEFWGKRWNLAFSEMTTVVIYRPVSKMVGRRAGLLASFVVSGLLHEIAISVPVLAGFGGPSLYFALHGLLVLFETGMSRVGFAIDSQPWLGRIWTMSAVVLPLPILFHRPFLSGVVWPIVGISG